MQKNSDTRSVKSFSKRLYWFFIPILCIVILDEFLKYEGLQRLPKEGSLLEPKVLQFAIHQNWGIAFDIPFKLEFVIFFSFLIGFWLVHALYKNWKQHPDIALATGTIFIGALGNLFDRIVYGFTVDYIILFGRSAINLSDLVIITGVFFLLLQSRKKRISTSLLTTPS